MALVCTDPATLAQYFIAPEHLSFTYRFVLSQPITTNVIPDALSYLPVLIKTLAFEAPIYLILLRWKKFTWSASLLHILLLNLLTHPVVVFALPTYFSQNGYSYAAYLGSAELFALYVEAFYLWSLCKVSPKMAFNFSLLANITSWWLGLYI